MLDLPESSADDGQATPHSSDPILNFLLEVRGRPRPAIGAGPAAGGDARRPGAAASLLVVDDDEEVLAVLRDILVRGGYDVVTAHDGEAAVTTFFRGDFDMLVTDLSMPGLNGLQLARRCRRLRPSVPVIIVTAFERMVADDDREAYGIHSVLTKPVRAAQLLAAIEGALPPR